MNMMSVLLGATGLLLVAALILSFGSMNKNVQDGPSQTEVTALRSEIEVLRAAENELRILRHQKINGNPLIATPYVAPYVAPIPADAGNTIELAAENTALKHELAESQSEVLKQEKRAETYKDEAGIAWQQKIESSDREQRLARIIKEALLIATVTEWSPSDGFAVLNVHRQESAQEGTVLAIRRGTGIIGQLKVSSLYNDGAVADPIPGTFMGGTLDILPGDELIIPPL